jgi:hypothetical protein
MNSRSGFYGTKSKVRLVFKYFRYIVAISFIDGGNRSIRRNYKDEHEREDKNILLK